MNLLLLAGKDLKRRHLLCQSKELETKVYIPCYPIELVLKTFPGWSVAKPDYSESKIVLAMVLELHLIHMCQFL